MARKRTCKKNKNHVKRKSQISPTPDKGTYVQRNHKDTLFRFIFRDKTKLLQLYNALNNSDYDDVDALTVTTVENVIYLGYKNDILSDVLKAHRKEVTTMFLVDYNPELHYKTLREEGYEDGMNDGVDIGETNINSLAQKMAADQRMDDFLRSTSDKAYQKQLLKEYGLSE